MAAPEAVHMSDLSGDWVMNKTLSDDPDAMLALQGVGWLTRRGIAYATVTLHAKQSAPPKDEANDPPTTLHIASTLTGGISGTIEDRVLDWEKREHEDHIFGKCVGQSRWLGLGGVDDAFLTEGWRDESANGRAGKGWMESYVVNEERGWTARQIWGFADIEGARYHTRRVVVTKGDTRVVARYIYNFVKRPDDYDKAKAQASEL